MERTIYKYTIDIKDEQLVELPKDSEILTAQMQGNNLCLWAIVYPDNKPEQRVIEIYGTGNPFPSIGMADRKYISTVTNNGFVWHIFEPV